VQAFLYAPPGSILDRYKSRPVPNPEFALKQRYTKEMTVGLYATKAHIISLTPRINWPPYAEKHTGIAVLGLEVVSVDELR